jgi:DNA-binding NarL/FixJ family response regulator
MINTKSARPVTSIKSLLPTWVAVKRVSICDERPSARAALTRVVAGAIPSVTDIDCSADGLELLGQFASHPADLVLIGIRNNKSSGTEAMRRLLDLYPATAVIVYGSVDDGPSLSAAIACGARGFLLWDANNPIATPARQRTLTVGRLSPTNGAIKVAARLTERELQILRGMTKGYSNGEIGRKLFLSEDTVKTHARSLFQKLGAHDRAHAVALGMRSDLVA